MKMLIHLIVAALVPALILGHQIIQCPDNLPINGPVTRLQIVGCDASPCHVNQGDSITYEVDFVAAVTTSEMRLAVNSTVFGIENPVVLPPELVNACNTIVGNCPVTQGQLLTQRATIPVSTELHGGIPVELKFYISHAPGFYCTCTVVNLVIN